MAKVTSLHDLLDRVFSIYVRVRDADKKGYIVCVSCPKREHWTKAENCHFASRYHMATRYHEQNCHSGCKKCNNYEKEMHIYMYGKFLDKKYGAGTADRIMMLSRTVKKFHDFELEAIIIHYVGEAAKIGKEKGLQANPVLRKALERAPRHLAAKCPDFV